MGMTGFDVFGTLISCKPSLTTLVKRVKKPKGTDKTAAPAYNYAFA